MVNPHVAASRKKMRAEERAKWSAPCTLTPGTILYTSQGYYVDFYEVIRATKAYVFVRQLNSVETSRDDAGFYGTAVPVLGSYADEVISRWRASGDMCKSYVQQLWDGKPVKFDHSR